MPVPPQIKKAVDDVDRQLHQEGPLTNVLATVEAKTGVKRLHIVLGVAGLQAIYLIFGHFAELVCNFMGFVYPAYMSIKAIESHTKEDDTQWLTYWVVFAVLSVAEFFSKQIVAVFPVYWLFKSLFLLYLYLPSTLGAAKIYHRFLQPIVSKHAKSIDQRVGDIAGRVNNAASNFINEVKERRD
ncbi:unnamed protein product [Caenorhabditis auriculariae]|uniref:Receptor expression-enhancing protein n=1 Tax=Caenorhabditis auriculariae TaxID=2777116 RepID=A0A8S1GNB5_9PELO|nr:unnamed protein product [Caenorhabditis auriculariae]